MGAQIAGQSVSVHAGERIDLVASVPTPFALNNCQWDVDTNVITGGWTNKSSNGPPDQNGAQEASVPANVYTDYAVIFKLSALGTLRRVQVSCDADNGVRASSYVNFDVDGPDGGAHAITAEMGMDSVIIDRFNPLYSPSLILKGVPANGGLVGISFAVGTNRPAGKYVWVQTVTDSIKNVSIQGVGSRNSQPYVLDNTYPYPSETTFSTSDSPAVGLSPEFGTIGRVFKARMYLLYDPALPSGCHGPSSVQGPDGSVTATPGNCTSIPVPMGFVEWHFGGCAINRLDQASGENGTTWSRSCHVNGIDAVVDDTSGYPSWSGNVQNVIR